MRCFCWYCGCLHDGRSRRSSTILPARQQPQQQQQRRRRRGMPVKTEPSCFARYWRVWRNCCCRFGLLPLALAPILTAGFLLSIYSSAGCSFVDLQIGFSPNTPAWNQSQAELGFFYYTNYQEPPHSNPLRQKLQGGCYPYTNAFTNTFVIMDRTWKVARIMAGIAGLSSLLCFVLIWLMVLTPIPTGSIWPCILLPLVMLSFIAEGSKFLLFDMALCSSSIWFPSGVDSLPQRAQSCSMGPSSVYAVVAGSLFLVALMLICFQTPEARVLDPNYGLFMGNELDLEADDPTIAGATATEFPRPPTVNGEEEDVPQLPSLETMADDDVYTEDPPSAITTSSVSESLPSRLTQSTASTPPPLPPIVHPITKSSAMTMRTFNMRNASLDSEDVVPPSIPPRSSISPAGVVRAQPLPTTTPTPEKAKASVDHRISGSRLSKMQELQVNAGLGSSTFIDQLVDELDASFKDDANTPNCSSNSSSSAREPVDQQHHVRGSSLLSFDDLVASNEGGGASSWYNGEDENDEDATYPTTDAGKRRPFQSHSTQQQHHHQPPRFL